MTQHPSPTRIAAQVVSGVGFICAGVIWHKGPTVRGLNTAVTIWCAAAIGILAGLNFSVMAILATVVLLVANIALHWIEHRYFNDPSSRERMKSCHD